MSLDPNERLEALRREVAAEPAMAAVRATAPTAAPEPAVPSAPASALPTAVPTAAPEPAAPSAPELHVPDEPPAGAPGWDITELLADTSLSTWVGVGLLAIGGYMVLSWFIPGIDLIGSLILLAAGIVLLAQHFVRGAGAWALYGGAVLTGMGAARAIGDLLPGSPRGLTALGIGLAFLAISYLRRSQAGGWGWEGIVAAAALALGGVQFLLGLLPGSPSVVDLVLPALLLLGGGALVARTRRRPAGPS
jgi:hypothetical protein